ncbi:MAG: protein-glutamate O-methyltransferase CheR [Pseudomonadota bacterium]
MQESTFERISDIALRETGQQLSPSKAYLIEARLAAICRRENLTNLDELAHCLTARPNPRFEAEIAAALTPKLTSFFGDKEQIERLYTHALPERLKASKTGRLRVLCCGVGTGQEAYSLAIRLSEMRDTPLGKAEIEIVGVDISQSSLATADSGLYNHFEIQKGLSVQRMMAHFTRLDSGDWQASQSLRDAVRFRPHNLLEAADGLGYFDVIFCRNILPSMGRTTQLQIIDRLKAQLLPEGLMFVGENETLIGLCDDMEPSRSVRGAYVRGGTDQSAEIAVA